MANVVVVYHSGFGHTKVVAEAVVRGAAGVAGAYAKLIFVDELPSPAKDQSLGGRWAEPESHGRLARGAGAIRQRQPGHDASAGGPQDARAVRQTRGAGSEALGGVALILGQF